MSRGKDYKKYTGLTVEVKHEDVGRALKTLSKKVQETGLLQEIKNRMFYEPPSVKKQRVKKEARIRWVKTVQELMELGLWHRDKKF